jgi:hypothetical protein
MLPRPVATYLIAITSVGWLANLIVGLVSGNSDPAVHGVFTFVVGALYAFGRKNRNGNSGDQGPVDGSRGDPDDNQ